MVEYEGVPEEAKKELELMQLEHDLENSQLVRRLRSEHKGGLMNKIIGLERLPQGSDGFGCVIACCRMLLKAQGQTDPGQSHAREIVEAANLVPFGHMGEAIISERTASAIGVRGARGLDNFRWSSVIADENFRKEIMEGSWMKQLITLIENHYLIMTTLPMRYIYEGCQGSGGHAFIVKGISLERGEVGFLINDPLEEADYIPGRQFILGKGNGFLVRNTIVAAPTSESVQLPMDLRINKTRDDRW